MTLIKKVGDFEINLSEQNDHKFNWKSFYKGVVFITVMSIVTFFAFEFVGGSHSIYYGLFVWGSMMGTSLMTSIYDDIVPSYLVSSNYYMSSDIYVKKENSDIDQIEVCKAAKKIEQKILDKIAKDNKLEMIASNCR